MFDRTLKAVESYGTVFKWGSGLLGKSAIVVGPLVVGILALGATLHTDSGKLGAMSLAVATFFAWYVPFIKFCEKHPADALLDGVHWAEHQQTLLASKAFPEGIKDAALSAPIPGAVTPKPVPHEGEQKS